MATLALLYAQILSVYVADGRVDYQRLAEKDLPKLDAYIGTLATLAIPPAPAPSSERDAALGALIDAYNALVLKAVIDNGRKRSVLDVKGFFDKKTYNVAGQTVTLDQLEKTLIQPLAKDPRTHFVLVCGAVGCPILESQPFAGSNLEQRMDAATRRYLSSNSGATVSKAELRLSKIFDWYHRDFGGPEGVLAFVKKHLPDEAKNLMGDRPKVTFLDYNWTLNQR